MEASERILVVHARLGDLTPTEKKLLWQLLSADGRNIIQNRSPWIGLYLLGMAEAGMLEILALARRRHHCGHGHQAFPAVPRAPSSRRAQVRRASETARKSARQAFAGPAGQVGRGRVCCAPPPKGFVHVIKKKGAEAVAHGVFARISSSASKGKDVKVWTFRFVASLWRGSPEKSCTSL